jgi:hypothetical protein
MKSPASKVNRRSAGGYRNLQHTASLWDEHMVIGPAGHNSGRVADISPREAYAERRRPMATVTQKTS